MGHVVGTTLAVIVLAGAAFAYDGVAMEKGRAAARVLNETLREKMAASIRKVGASDTVAVCSYQAWALAAEVEKTRGMQVRRTSLLLRNPGNAPDAYEKDLLERLEALRKQGKLPVEVLEEKVVEGERVYRYAKPLLVEQMCLTCHGRGEEISWDVRRELEIRYPKDTATGYRLGDLRGIVSVTIPVR